MNMKGFNGHVSRCVRQACQAFCHASLCPVNPCYLLPNKTLCQRFNLARSNNDNNGHNVTNWWPNMGSHIVSQQLIINVEVKLNQFLEKMQKKKKKKAQQEEMLQTRKTKGESDWNVQSNNRPANTQFKWHENIVGVESGKTCVTSKRDRWRWCNWTFVSNCNNILWPPRSLMLCTGMLTKIKWKPNLNDGKFYNNMGRLRHTI